MELEGPKGRAPAGHAKLLSSLATPLAVQLERPLARDGASRLIYHPTCTRSEQSRPGGKKLKSKSNRAH
jgi:hypothetical protein